MFWQTLAGSVVYGGKDSVRVLQNPWYRWLQFSDRAIQTLVSRRHPWKPVMRYLGAFTLPARLSGGNTCLLGLGGGAVLHFLSHIHHDMPLLAVEYNPEILKIARTFFWLDTLPNTTVIEADAFAVLAQTDETFDHLLVDVATAEGLPAACFEDAFFADCWRALSPNGILALNLSSPRRLHALLEPLRTRFEETLSIPIRGCANIIILAGNGGSLSRLLSLPECQEFFRRVEWVASVGRVGWAR